MRAVDVGIRHDDDLVVAQLVGIELVAYPGSERRDERADFLAGQHLVHARALDVEDFAAQRQHRLERAIAALLGRAAGAVALDDEQFGFRGVALLAIGELAGEGRHIERALSARELARLARGLARRRRLDHLADDDPGLRRMLLEPILQRLVDDRLDHRADLGGDELVLGLRGEFRVRHLAREDRREPFAAIIAGERNPLLLRHAALLGIAGDLARERAAEAGEVGTAVALRDRVGEAQHRLVVAVVPPQRALDRDALALALDHDRRGNERRLVAVEIFDEGLDPALVAQLLALLHRMAHVGEHDQHARVEEGELAQPVLQRREIELGHGECFRARQERHLGAALALRGADDRQRLDRLAVAEFHEVFLVVAPDGELEPARQRIHHGHADAVQPAGDLVGVLVEFPAGVELGHDDLGRRDPFALVNVGRDAAPVVAHRAGAVRIERDDDLFGEAGERLVDGVVDDLVHHVVQAGTVVGVADIHARPLAHGIEALENLDRIRIVFGGDRGSLAGRFGHGEICESLFEVDGRTKVV